jgi:hypothetical protein
MTEKSDSANVVGVGSRVWGTCSWGGQALYYFIITPNMVRESKGWVLSLEGEEK